MPGGSIPYKTECEKLMEQWTGNFPLDDEYKNMAWITKRITALITDKDLKIVLAGQFGQLDPTTKESGIDFDMDSGNVQAQLLKMATEHGTDARLCSKDKSINLVFKFMPITGNEDPEDLTVGWKDLGLSSPIGLEFDT